MIRVLFVCLGNICRSPMADAVFQQMVKQAGLEQKIAVDSAGTGSWHVGETAHRGTLKVLKQHDIPYRGRARQFSRSDLEAFDYVLAMDRSNLSTIQSRTSNNNPKAEIALFLSYAQDKSLIDVDEVPDPYYDNRFEHVYQLVEKGSQALLSHIRDVHNL